MPSNLNFSKLEVNYNISMQQHITKEQIRLNPTKNQLEKQVSTSEHVHNYNQKLLEKHFSSGATF